MFFFQQKWRQEAQDRSARLEASYDVTLEPLGDSTRRVAQGELKVRIPLVGGRVERAIASGLEEHAAAEADLLGTWVTERA